ncbi:tripartite tricarboxylate transporter substrate binding protein [Xylophilus rhododendri]|uniref:Tripartite tricarboxylate transporter substrate binding protein n=1 Tax=Xylophilus rhododendri TaxID=2697032 RepID=A0A857JB09_9BURK|nr:tripartite tricarboxylate transporter substrate binding protein [Xylophilus rhododendri]QHJ01127.1 tripartite tricarboxylate transporter substrate binding protein [Xylophilus rhododendri]
MTRLKATLAGALLTLSTLSAHAQAAWPERGITILLPTAAGSSFDVNVRRFAELLSRSLGQPVVIDNRAGAGSAIALAAVARAKPDGYTLGVGNAAGLAITPELNAKPGYDTASSFEYIGRFTRQANILVVRKDLPVNSVAELTAYAKKHPGELSMGSQGTGSTGHLSGEIYKTLAGIDFVHVPYKGGPQAIQDLLGGRVDFIFENTSTIEPQITSGHVKALAVTSRDRAAIFPKLPTMDEAGVKGYEAVSWTALLAPAGTPQAIVERLNAELNKAFADPGFQKFLADRGTILDGGSSAAAREFARTERAKWGAVIKASKITAD